MVNTPKMIVGGCLCGRVRYSASAQPSSVLYCHCTMCRRATGQPSVAAAYFNCDEIEFTEGEPRLFAATAYAERGFCECCGTPLFYHSVMPELRDKICLMLGTFDDATDFPPTGHWNIETAVPFALHDDGLPRHRQSESKFWWVRDSIAKGE